MTSREVGTRRIMACLVDEDGAHERRHHRARESAARLAGRGTRRAAASGIREALGAEEVALAVVAEEDGLALGVELAVLDEGARLVVANALPDGRSTRLR